MVKKASNSLYTTNNLAILLSIIELISKYIDLDNLKQKIVKAYYWIVDDFPRIKVELWLVLLIVLLVVIILFAIIKFIFMNQKWKNEEFLEYQSDNIEGHNWAWQWENIGGKYDLGPMTMVCAQCGTFMYYTGSGYFRCPRCKHQIDRVPNMDDVRRVIMDNAVRKLWKKPKPQ